MSDGQRDDNANTGAVNRGAVNREEGVKVDMVREDLADFPEFALPAGYRFRPFQPGDDATWTAIQAAAEPFLEVTPALFEGQFGGHEDALPERMVFVQTEAGADVASITAWWERNRENPDERGRIHWVVVHPSHQRRGLTKPMMTWAMRRLAQSHSAAMLDTSSARIWAIKVYLDFGFHPDPAQMAEKPEVAAAWREMQARLQHPLLARWVGV